VHGWYYLNRRWQFPRTRGVEHSFPTRRSSDLLLGVGPWGAALAGLAVVLGNNFNVLLGFRGGKGIATSIGVMLVLEPLVALFCIVLGVFTILVSRYVSLGSLVGMVALPLFLIARGS